MRALAPQQLESFFPTLQFITERLLRRWRRSAKAGTDTDVLQDLTRFTVDATATLVFGKDVNTLEAGEDAIQRHLGVIFPMISYRINALFPYWRYFRLPGLPARPFPEGAARIRSEMIAEARERMRRAPAEKPRNLLEAMLTLRDEPDSGFSDADVYANILTLLLAARTPRPTARWPCTSWPASRNCNHSCSVRPQRAGRSARSMTFADTAKLVCSKASRSKRCGCGP